MPSDHTVQLNVYSSPKRKRDAAEPASNVPSSLPVTPSLNTDLPVHSVPEEEGIQPGDGSPRTTVAGRFQNLHIQPTGVKLNFGRRDDGEASQKKSRLMEQDHNTTDSSDNDRTVHGSWTPRRQVAEWTGESSKATATEEVQEIATRTVEAPVVPYPSPEVIQDSTLIPPDSSKQPARAKDQTSAPPSPPPTDSRTWQDSEITGHAPTDPLDDGYGINGIGFRPTPAVAYARAQKRTQQIQDWRNREAREGRQRRSERRRGIGGGATDGGERRVSDQRRRVRFYEG